MRTNIIKTIIGLTLSVFSISASAQCSATITGFNVSYGANGTATVAPSINGSVSPTQTMYYWNTWGGNQTSGVFDQQGVFQFPANGTYSVCLSFNDSAAMCSSNYYCDVVTITNSSNTSCQAGFTYYTDSSCVTYFSNTSVGNNLTYQWYVNGINYGGASPNITLPNGWNTATLYSYSNGAFCDSVSQYININCNGNQGGCNAAFTTSTDSNCVTHFTNYSTGSNLTYQWYDMSNGFGLISTQQNPSLNLSQGGHYITLYSYSNGQYCDSLTQYVDVNCGGNPSGSCNASFTYYTDSVNCMTYFNTTSTGTNLSYVWNINGAYYNTSNPSLYLSNGTAVISLEVYSSGALCDSVYSSVSINCGNSNPTGCQVDSYFTVFADSSNAGNYFAYNMSTGNGNLTYLWDFGDGTSSTQQYPFHQYAVPGNYVLCLTVTSTNGFFTCSDTYCDSSSVQRMAAGFLMSQISVIPQSTTGIKEDNLVKGLKAFPNPMLDVLVVELELSSVQPGLTCTLIDALGKVVITKNINEEKTSLNTNNLDQGFYFLTVSNEKGKTLKTIKLVK